MAKPRTKKKKERKPGRKKHRKDLPAIFDYKDEAVLRKFMTDRGKIAARRITGIAAKRQRELATAIKRARHLGLVPFVREHYR